jgi:aryl-alcohol dehydrogenase-like predicted oxidoreductase
MRTVVFDGWPTPVSALGFGCASLGSRVSRKAGLAAIDRALAAGVTWFDVAPSYGDGEAETILGEALAGTGVAIVTKVGLRAHVSGVLIKSMRALARPVVAAIPGLRSTVKRARSGTIARVPLNPEAIRDSIGRSLERLRVDRVAVLALHDPSDDDMSRDEVLRGLDDVKRQGLAMRIGIAGSFTNFVAANRISSAIDVAQFAASPTAAFSEQVATVRAQGAFAVAHSVFVAQGDVARAGRADPQAALRYCFGANPAGVVLASSLTPEHLKANVAVACEQPDASFAAAVETALRGERRLG